MRDVRPSERLETRHFSEKVGTGGDAAYPRGMFDFVVSVFRWATRVWASGFLLATDDYPPFSLQ